ncbi:MAG: hypothetical protein A2Y53_03745 [Chloroflexi bacterium RBG_16_47_49]|nr:MAG: hypothetical protein A2Y53_03745 [Chloroflexi bacterium RBG_16_47_49]
MSQDLFTNETHMSNRQGYLRTSDRFLVDGDEIQNIEAGQMYYNDVTDILYIYDGTAWSGRLTVAM